ncbi:MAG: hypothetical protein EPO64_01270 [Nitrospirae bacterium]|nr:MAG: hypothetical protein EPO64_01270 [Nitrospirota bacterium]
MLKALLSCAVLLCTACAGPSFISRPVHNDPSWLVRLDAYADIGKGTELRYNHPAEWNEAELREILGRLLLQERVGLLEQKPPPQPAFSPDEIDFLTPRLQEAFRMARPSEWVVFSVARSTGATQEVTSGGFFLKDRRLHVLLANHREPVSPEEAMAVRENPVSGLKGRGNILTFDPARFVLTTQTSWLGGYSGAAASEMILDQTGFLEAARRPVMPMAPALALPPPTAAPATTPAAAQPTPSVAPQPPASLPAQTKTGGAAKPNVQTQMQKLQEEIEQLKQKLAEQSEELAKLKSKSADTKPSKKKTAPKQPAQ